MGDNPPITAPLKGVENLKVRDSRWYLPEFSDKNDISPANSTRAKRVNFVADRLWAQSRTRRENYARYESLYCNERITGLTPRRFNARTVMLANAKMTFNGCRSASDAYVAKITNQNPRVSFVTSGASWEVRQKAKRLEKFNDGMLRTQDAYEMGRQLQLDAAKLGTAVVMILQEGHDEGAHIIYERDTADCWFCDDEEAHNGDPRVLYRRKYYDRLQAMAMFPDAAEYIAIADRVTEDGSDKEPVSYNTDTVCITWAMHLPSGMGVWGREGTDTGDGLMVVTVGNVKAEETKITRYPCEFLYVQKPSHGIWGDGFVAQLAPLQFELDSLLSMTRNSMKMSGVRILAHNQSQVNPMSIAGIPNALLKWGGEVAPQAVVWPAVAPEVYTHGDRIWQRMFEVVGISQLSAQSQKPAGLNSGKALQTYADIESERFQVSYRLYQNFFLRLARQTIALAREIGDENPDFMIKTVTRKTMRAVKWADANLDDNDFEMMEAATSAFALTPEAKMQQIQDSLNSGSPLITPQEGRRLLEDPDLDAFDAMADASYNLVMDQISDILEEGEFNPPVPMMNLDEAIKLGQFSWLEALRQGAPQDRLDMLEDWIQQAIDLQPPPPAPVMPHPGPMPPGAHPPGPQKP